VPPVDRAPPFADVPPLARLPPLDLALPVVVAPPVEVFAPPSPDNPPDETALPPVASSDGATRSIAVPPQLARTTAPAMNAAAHSRAERTL